MSGASPTRAVLLWLFNGDRLAAHATEAISAAARAEGVLISPVSAWEIGLLARPRPNRPALRFLPDPKAWFAAALAAPSIRLTPLMPEAALDAASLPEPLHADPGDRLLIATARHLGVPIVTRDSHILAYAETGEVGAIAC